MNLSRENHECHTSKELLAKMAITIFIIIGKNLRLRGVVSYIVVHFYPMKF